MQKSYEILIDKLNKFIREYYKNLIVRGIIYSMFGLFSMLIIFGVMLTNKIDTPNIVSSSSNQVIGFFAASFLFFDQC